MKDNRLKEQVLKEIREALINKNPIDNRELTVTVGNTFIDAGNEDLSVLFAQNFTQRGGTMYYCYNENDIRNRILDIQRRHGEVTIGCGSDNLTSFIGHLGIENRCTCDPDHRYPLGATLCEALTAWQGGVIISSNQGLGSTMPGLSEATIVLAFTSQVVPDWEAANERLKDLYPSFPDNLMLTNPASYAFRKGLQKMYLILIEDEG